MQGPVSRKIMVYVICNIVCSAVLTSTFAEVSNKRNLFKIYFIKNALNMSASPAWFPYKEICFVGKILFKLKKTLKFEEDWKNFTKNQSLN